MHVRYVSWGPRRYHREPIPVYRRSVWEIQIVRGSARPVFGIGEEELGVTTGDVPEDDTGDGDAALHLWVFRPESVHGWTDTADGLSTIAVVHLDSVPEELRRGMRDYLWVGLTIHDGDRGVAHLLHAVEELSPPSLPSAAQSQGWDQVASLRTAAWVFAATAEVVAALGGPQPASRREELLTERVIAWYEANMHRACTLAEIGRAVAASESSIGRAFRREHQCSTREALLTRRMERAGWMIRNRGESFLEIAEACGYRDQSAFSRAVRCYFGKSPRALRGASSTR
jgi:AraC-like DNA-binding protein